MGRRVLLTWQVLIAAAARRETLTYSQGGIEDRFPGAQQAVGRYLDPISAFCRAEGLPALTVIVVSASTGKPSQVPDGVEDVDYARELVFRHPWPATAPPVVA